MSSLIHPLKGSIEYSDVIKRSVAGRELGSKRHITTTSRLQHGGGRTPRSAAPAYCNACGASNAVLVWSTPAGAHARAASACGRAVHSRIWDHGQVVELGQWTLQRPARVTLVLPRPFSWLRSRRLAIGGFPKEEQHWASLEAAGFRKVFSCCDPSEAPWNPPHHWRSERLALPDHRRSVAPSAEILHEGLDRLQKLLQGDDALYLHCWAGMERSPLMAIGLLCREESISIFEALRQVRSLHPEAKPITKHLVVLENLLIEEKQEKINRQRNE